MFISLESNRRSARLYYAAREHICKLSVTNIECIGTCAPRCVSVWLALRLKLEKLYTMWKFLTIQDLKNYTHFKKGSYDFSNVLVIET